MREGVRHGSATAETQVISGVTGEQYGTRQSVVVDLRRSASLNS